MVAIYKNRLEIKDKKFLNKDFILYRNLLLEIILKKQAWKAVNAWKIQICKRENIFYNFLENDCKTAKAMLLLIC